MTSNCKRLLLLSTLTTGALILGNSQHADAKKCFLGTPQDPKVLCTSYEFNLPFYIRASNTEIPALHVLSHYNDTATVATQRSLRLGIQNTGAGKITQAAALDLSAPSNSGTGEIETYYGIYINTPTVAENNYAIYSAGGTNFFGGKIHATEICDQTGANCKIVADGWGSGGGGNGNGSVTSITAGNGLTGGTITTTGTIAADTGTTAGKIVQLDSNGALPVVSGANLTNISANSLSGNPVSAATVASGEVLGFNGTAWTNKTLGISDISGLATNLGSKLDAANMPASCAANQTLTFSSPTGMWACSNIVVTPSVFGTQNEGVVLAAPASGNGIASFRKIALADLPAGMPSGTVTSISAGNGLTGGTVTSTGTIAVDVGTTANKIVQLNSDGQLPAVNAQNLTNVNAAKLAGQEFEFTTPSQGQLLAFDGTKWENKSLAATDIPGLDTALNSKLDLANLPASCAANQTLTFSSPAGQWTCSNITVSPAALGTQAANLVIASPNGSSGAPQFRALTESDLPTTLLARSWSEDANSNVYRANGRVGIGNNDPQSPLHVTGAIRADQICDANGGNCKTVADGWSSGGGSGTLTSITAGVGLKGGTITQSGTLSVDVGTGPGQIVQLDPGGYLPVLNGNALQEVNADRIMDYPVIEGGLGNILSFTGYSWEIKALQTEDVAHLPEYLDNKLNRYIIPTDCMMGQTLRADMGQFYCTPFSPELFTHSEQGKVVATGAIGSGSSYTQFRRLELSDLPDTVSNSIARFTETDGDLYRNTGRIGFGIHFKPEAHLDSYYNVPAPGTEVEGTLVAGRSQSVIRYAWDQTEHIIGHIGRILTQNDQTGILDTLTALSGGISHKGTGTIMSSTGLSVSFQNRGDATVENNVGVYVSAPQNRANGELIQYSGVYIQEPTVATNANFSIFSEGGLNFFGGDVEVMGTIRATTICDEMGNNCKAISDGWTTGPTSLDLTELKKNNIELRKDNAELRKQLKELSEQVKLIAQKQTTQTRNVAKAQ